MNKFNNFLFILIFFGASAHAMDNVTRGKRLFRAAGDGDYKLIEELIEAGVPVDYRTRNGCTPLRAAVANNQTECVRVLIEKKAEVNRVVDDIMGDIGGTALMHAVGHCYHECTRLLLNAGARVNLVDNYGKAALVGAAWSGCYTCIRMLIDAGTRVDFVDHRGETILMVAEKSGHHFTLVE